MINRVRKWDNSADLEALTAGKVSCDFGSEELKRQIESCAKLLGAHATSGAGIIDPRQNPEIMAGKAMNFVVLVGKWGRLVLCEPKIEKGQYLKELRAVNRKSCFSSPSVERAYFITPGVAKVEAKDAMGEAVELDFSGGGWDSFKELIGFYDDFLSGTITREAFERAAIEGVVFAAKDIEAANAKGISTDDLFFDEINERRLTKTERIINDEDVGGGSPMIAPPARALRFPMGRDRGGQPLWPLIR